MRVEAAAQVATAAARDAFDQIQQRIGIEQGSDARRLDLLSAEIARITREVADARGEDAAKPQILEANIARVEGQKAVDNTSQQFIDVRRSSTRRSFRWWRSPRRSRTSGGSVPRLRPASTSRSIGWPSSTTLGRDPRFASSPRARQRAARAAARAVDEKEEAQTRDDHIVRDKDEQLAQWEKAATREPR